MSSGNAEELTSPREQALVSGGEDVQYRALKRKRQSESGAEYSRCTPKKSCASLNDMEERSDMIRVELQQMRERQERGLALREQELALQQQRLEDDRKERELHLEESRVRTELIKALVSKLK